MTDPNTVLERIRDLAHMIKDNHCDESVEAVGLADYVLDLDILAGQGHLPRDWVPF